MQERDFPVGHPAASDYKGQPYHPNRAPFEEDFPVGHPARGGRNVSLLDTPDGLHAHHLKQSQDLQALAMMGSLPPLVDDTTGKEVDLTPQELAHIYAVRNALPASMAAEVTDHYKLEPLTRAEDVPEQKTFSAAEQAVMILIKRGYSPERAKELIDKYGVPDTLREHEQDAHR
jgi:hypothetical protein